MNEILRFIVKYCDQLYEKYGFRFVDSDVADSFDSCALIMENDFLKLEFTRNRGFLSLDFYNKDDKNKYGYSIDIVRQYINKEADHSWLDDNNGIFLKHNMKYILGLFSQDKEKLQIMFKGFHALEQERSKRLLG